MYGWLPFLLFSLNTLILTKFTESYSYFGFYETFLSFQKELFFRELYLSVVKKTTKAAKLFWLPQLYMKIKRNIFRLQGERRIELPPRAENFRFIYT